MDSFESGKGFIGFVVSMVLIRTIFVISVTNHAEILIKTP